MRVEKECLAGEGEKRDCAVCFVKRFCGIFV